MTEDEIQKRIRYLQGQIEVLERENITLNKNIYNLEDSSLDVFDLAGKWEKRLSDCFSTVKSNLAKVDSKSGFNSYYLEQINSILSGKEATEIGDCLGIIKSDVYTKICEFEEKISSNNNKIYQFQNEIDELEVMQAITGVK